MPGSYSEYQVKEEHILGEDNELHFGHFSFEKPMNIQVFNQQINPEFRKV